MALTGAQGQVTEPVTYDPSFLMLTIEGQSFVHVNSVEVTPIEDEEYVTEKASTGQRAWIRTPEFGAEMTIEFSGGLPASQRQFLRDLLGKCNVTASIYDSSSNAGCGEGTDDGITLTNGRIVQMPDFSRDDSEPTMEVVIQSPHAEWGKK